MEDFAVNDKAARNRFRDLKARAEKDIGAVSDDRAEDRRHIALTGIEIDLGGRFSAGNAKRRSFAADGDISRERAKSRR